MTLNRDELQQRLDFAVAAAQEAGDLILDYYQSSRLQVDRKSDASPVTEADRNAELLLRKKLTEQFPQDGFLGEEHGEVESKNGLRWIVDPIDGTKAFVAGVPMFGTLIGLESDDDVHVGVCRFPALNEVMFAATGLGAQWQIGDQPAKPIHVSQTAELSESLLCYTELSLYESSSRRDAFDALRKQCRGVRGWGDCYGHMLIATGRADIIADPAMNPWDAAALLPIVREAGGHYLSWSGEATIHGGDGISVNAALKDSVMAILQGN